MIAWLERSFNIHWGVTKYMRVAAERMEFTPEFLPYKMVIVLDHLWPCLCRSIN